MGRRPQPERRAALLEACTDEVLRQGLPGLTLARLAAAAGTSSRMLLYHFSTRDQLVLEALQEARRRQQEVFGELLALRTGVPYGTVVAEAWDGITAPELRPYLRLSSSTTSHRSNPVDRVSGPINHRLAAHDRGRATRRWTPRRCPAGNRDHRRTPRAISTPPPTMNAPPTGSERSRNCSCPSPGRRSLHGTAITMR